MFFFYSWVNQILFEFNTPYSLDLNKLWGNYNASGVFVVSFVWGSMLSVKCNQYIFSPMSHYSGWESGLILTPSIMLMCLGSGSLDLGYKLDSTAPGSLLVGAVGHQWYWTYEFFELGIKFDSYMTSYSELLSGSFRLMEVDNPLPLPKGSVTMIFTSEDVIHSFSVPSLYLKMDCNPGKFNQVSLNMPFFGQFWGSCAELCGANHSYMPILVEVMDMYNWGKVTSSMM